MTHNIPHFIGELELEPVPDLEPKKLVWWKRWTRWIYDWTEVHQWKLLKDFGYVAKDGIVWYASAGEIVDGASIPRPFWTIIGGPFEGRYIYASVIHDVYCNRQTRPSQEVHAIFDEIMEFCDVIEWKRNAMALAVRTCGPKWVVK